MIVHPRYLEPSLSIIRKPDIYCMSSKTGSVAENKTTRCYLGLFLPNVFAQTTIISAGEPTIW